MYSALVIGCGNIGALYDFNTEQIITHAKAIYTNPEFSLSVFDTNEQVSKKISGKYNCKIVNEISEQSLRSFDCVSICTPTATHSEYLEKAFEAQVRVIICEKPVSNEGAELRSIREKYLRENSKVIVNYTRRFQPAYAELKDTISGILQNELLTNINIRYQKGFLNNCSHAFDIIEYLTGSEIILKQVKIHNSLPDYFSDDPTLSLQAMWNSVNVTITGLTGVRFSHFEIDLYFSYHKICMKNSGHTIEIYKSRVDERLLQPLTPQDHFTRENCLQDYMKFVLHQAYCLLDGHEPTDNFLNSVDLVLRMKTYMNT